ncbi:Laccase I [Mycena venus]|uniref:laccase n=1 Tax=Mycena venus TaxID=2733690 RepID=A0A8H7D8U2_9AGAR|nr:Laccase I [Mycena venus]
MSLSSLLVLSMLSGVLCAILPPITNLSIVNKVMAPDGYSRNTALAGGTFPGPLITNTKDLPFAINVENYLTDPTMYLSTSIHWHGLFQKNTSWADGVSFVTQCPIVPDHSFLYEFSAPGQAGTYWYHSHLSTQYCDGVRGPLVIYDPEDPQKYLYDIDDASTVITLADWYHYASKTAPPPNLPVSNSTLINGWSEFHTVFLYRPGLPIFKQPRSPLAVINVVHGLRYRFRLVSISCAPNFVFSIDGHSLTIIEVDGVNHEPLTVDSIQIFTGQRYSFVLNATQAVDNYWVRANPDMASAVNTGFEGGINSAILRYHGAPDVEPTTTNATSTKPLVETALRPLIPQPAPGGGYPGGGDVNLNLNITFNFTDFEFEINGASFNPPNVPVLLQILSGAQSAQDLLPPGSVYTLPPNKVIEISIPGGSPAAPHPFHLHGHNFWVVRSAGNSSYNWDNPVIRDVVSTGPSPNDNVTIRFVTDNAGPWFLHCHIDWHLDIGLAIVFAEDTGSLAHEHTPDAWKDLCPLYDPLRRGPL